MAEWHAAKGIGGDCRVADRGGIGMLAGVPEAFRLFIECSTPRASLALARGAAVLFEDAFTSDRSHNAMLFAPLERALSLIPEGETLATVVIGTGPGSYSGTRVGIAAGQGVAMVHGCPAVGLSSLFAVPAAAGGEALAVGDARRGSAWKLAIDREKPDDEPVLCSLDELAEEIRDALSAGLPVISLEPAGKIGLPEDLASAIRVVRPEATGLAEAWLGLDPAARARLEQIPPQPVYLRPPHVTMAKAGHPLLRK